MIFKEKLDYEASLMLEINKRHENQLAQAREENHIDISILAVEHQRRMLLSNLKHAHSCYQEKIIILLGAALAKSGPLDFPSEQSFLLFSAHEKGLGHMFQKWLSCSLILFFCVATSQT